ncbi:glycosyltransferase family 2 protein [Zunongwangia sp.]|uniref:glycosyltransferase family 2 protein n=1 Tax=Zunongwangia sp. TaxID=1965325 RepID=UPI003AA8D603
MIVLVHQKGKKLCSIIRNGIYLQITSNNLISSFWKVAKDYPEELIVWVEEKFESQLSEAGFKKVFHHDLIMASYSIETTFFSDDIGYIDDFPFININREVKYPTWLMSSDLGGIKGKVASRFLSSFDKIHNFDYLLNAIAKIGQQNGLFCYHAPQLSYQKSAGLIYRSTRSQLFRFVFQFYKKYRGGILFWCLRKYGKENVVKQLVHLSSKSFFGLEIDFSDFKIKSSKNVQFDSIDVIIPTIGRPSHLLNVLEDLKKQSFLPTKVIIVEQNPEENSKSDFDFKEEEWPFIIDHTFTRQAGACKARNLALSRVVSDWVFLCDDDVRLQHDLLNNIIGSIELWGADAVNLNEKNISNKYIKIKQWGAFGSGLAILKSSTIENNLFHLSFEFGYGEDLDFGMQLRKKGIDIIFMPNLEITHLKAPRGGFRQKIDKPWANANPSPKPSPTIMAYVKRNYTKKQILGYKTILWIKFYRAQSIKNPIRYRKEMQKRWEISETWADKLLKANS